MVPTTSPLSGELGYEESDARTSGANRRFWKLVALAGGSALVACAWLALRFGGRDVTTAADDFGQVLAALLAAAGAATAMRREHGRIALGWCLLAVAELGYAYGQGVYSWREVIDGRLLTSAPALSDPGFLAAIVFSLAAMMVFFSPPAGLTSRLRVIVDALIVGSGLLLASWLLVLGPAYDARSEAFSSEALAILYLVGTIVILSTAMMVAQRSRTVDRLPLGWIMVAAGAITVANANFLYETQKSVYATHRVLDAGWIIGFLVLGLAAISPVTPNPARGSKRDTVLFPYIPVLIGASLVAIHLADGDLDRFGAWCVLAVLLFVVIRQVLVLRENRTLTDDLEMQVQSRTRELRLSEQRLSSVIQSVSDVISVISTDGTILYTARQRGSCSDTAKSS